MNRKIRGNVFETNSSSMHSFTINSGTKTINNLEIDEFDGYIHTELDEFGWEICNYYDAAAKLAYILLIAASTTAYRISFWMHHSEVRENIANFMETDEFKKIEDAVKEEFPECNGIMIEEHSYGYIDHQSLGFHSLDDFLKYVGVDTVHEFIFGDVILRTDNDNH